ncbi:MAG: PorT family protein [Prevotellaceae bacterium]|nr:PorT family protein [Prevotellaceae bacterium]
MAKIKNILSIAFLLLVVPAAAQVCCEKHKPYLSVWEYPRAQKLNLLDREYSRFLHFGFGLGVNAFDFSQIHNSGNTVYIPGQGNAILFADLVHIKLGFNINAIIDYRLVNNLDIRFLPGIFFGQRQFDFYRSDTKGIIQSMPLTSNYLEFPVVLKYSANRYTNFKPYVVSGINTRVNLSNETNIDAGRYIGLVKFEPFAEFGIGFDFYLEYFRMSTEFKISAGLINSLNKTEVAGYEYYRQSLKSMRSNTIGFTVSFEL